MQLWQFLYTLLSDPDKKYGDLIQWTSNTKAREFRLLEPEAVAILVGGAQKQEKYELRQTQSLSAILL